MRRGGRDGRFETHDELEIALGTDIDGVRESDGVAFKSWKKGKREEISCFEGIDIDI